MQAIESKIECATALGPWTGEGHDAVTRVHRLFLHNKDADLDVVKAAHRTLVAARGLPEPKVQDEERYNLDRITKFLEKYMHEQKKR